jgi:hypothetical protein
MKFRELHALTLHESFECVYSFSEEIYAGAKNLIGLGRERERE